MALPNLASATDTARRLVEPVLAVVFPSRCPACSRALAHPTRGPLCEACWEALPRHHGRLCGCGLPLPPDLALCGRCRRGRQTFAAGVSLGPYEGGLRTVIHELKYRGKRRVAVRLADALLAERGVRELRPGSWHAGWAGPARPRRSCAGRTPPPRRASPRPRDGATSPAPSRSAATPR